MSIKYSDSGFLDGADETKKLSFDVSGVTTGTTRTITMPDGDTKLYTGDGTSGQVLTSGGAGVAPTFQTAAGGGATDIDGLSDAVTSDTGNLGLGSSAVDSITTGDYNTGLGGNALTANTSGTWNTAVGYNSMLVNNGDYNDAFGKDSLKANTTGHQNVAIGVEALGANTSGYQNVALGKSADNGLTTGSDNVAIGRDVNSSSATATNEFTLGFTNISNLRCNDTSISALSDQRDKAEITDLPDSAGLDLINALRPVTYYWDRREWYDDGVPDGSKIKSNWRRWKPNSGLKQGFIAQEVEEAITGEKCLEDSMVVSGTEDKKEFAPQHLLTNAIKAIQQLSAEMEILKSEIATLKGV